MSGDFFRLNGPHLFSDQEKDTLTFLSKIGAIPVNSALRPSVAIEQNPVQSTAANPFADINSRSALADIYDSGFLLIQNNHIPILKEACTLTYRSTQSKTSLDDDFLLYIANTELRYSVEIALAVDPQDRNYNADQKAFNQAYQQLIAVISNIENPLLKASVELPASYKHEIETSFLLKFGKTSVGAKRKWRRDRFYFSLLTIYQAFSGRNPSGSKGGGPCLRFISKLVDILRDILKESANQTDDVSGLSELWNLPQSKDFLHEWFKSAGGGLVIQKGVSLALQQHQLKYDSLNGSHVCTL